MEPVVAVLYQVAGAVVPQEVTRYAVIVEVVVLAQVAVLCDACSMESRAADSSTVGHVHNLAVSIL